MNHKNSITFSFVYRYIYFDSRLLAYAGAYTVPIAHPLIGGQCFPVKYEVI